MLTPQLEFEPSEPVRQALARVGRTEDLRFSPDNRLLAIAGYGRELCLILRIDFEETSEGLRVVADDFIELASDGIQKLHGLDFIDDRTLVCANRFGRVSIVELPAGDLGGRQVEVKARRQLGLAMFSKLKSPGSLATMRGAGGEVELLVCSNYTHRVRRHKLDPTANYRETRGEVLLKRGLKIPDGIAVSHDGRWIAVSSHGTHDVKIFAASPDLGPNTEPAGILPGVDYPHGLRFTADDRQLLVADAGNPVVQVYEARVGWRGTFEPVSAAVVLDDAAFTRGRTNPEEGGPKGIDIDRSGRVVATTCEEQPLAFFSLAAMTALQSGREVDVALSAN